MKKPLAALWRLALAAVVSVVLLIGIANVITQPVASPQAPTARNSPTCLDSTRKTTCAFAEYGSARSKRSG